MAERLPELLSDLVPTPILGTAELTHRAFAGATVEQLLQAVDRPAATTQAAAARALDAAIVHQLAFQKDHAMAMQSAALSICQLYRVQGRYDARAPGKLRLLALMDPGDLMTNTPLDFITRELNVQLDLLYLVPDEGLPRAVPDHDVAYIGGGDIAAPVALQRRAELFRTWPRPVLNDPRRVSRLARDTLSQSLAGIPGLCSPVCEKLTRQDLTGGLVLDYPVLIRPVGSHAGANLTKACDADDIAAYLGAVDATSYYVTKFVDYRSADGMFRKYRVALIDRRPFLCHLGVSADWMIHYLNAGMTDDAPKRQEEARAMATFDAAFGHRHAAAFAALNDRIGLDYYTVDCGETLDGQLVIFEADAEAIIHMMDPPDLFPYKPPQMRTVFTAFGAMLARRSGEAGSRLAA